MTRGQRVKRVLGREWGFIFLSLITIVTTYAVVTTLGWLWGVLTIVAVMILVKIERAGG